MTGFDIGPRHVGDGSPCLIVAEIGQAHDGSLGTAHAYIDAVAKAGVDAVKFQCHTGDPHDQWRVKPVWCQDLDRQAYWKRTGFLQAEWVELEYHARAPLDMVFLCSPFSVEAVELLDPLVPAWKVPSGEITNEPLLEAIKATGKPVILSTGMSTHEEINAACAVFWDAGIKPAILQCTSKYPCSPEDIGLEEMALWPAAGLSDHSGTIYPGLAAVALGCDILEVHVVFSRDCFGPDVESSITIAELGQLVEGVRFIEKAKTPVDKDEMAKELEPMRELFMGRHKRRAATACSETG